MPVQLFFFFSSRRRHTRLQGDWSSDVCSSDLTAWRKAPSTRSCSPICPNSSDNRRRTHMLADSLRQWLDAHADSLDEGPAHAHEVLPRLAQHGLFGLGVPVAEGGQGGSLGDALEAIAGVAGHSLTAGFLFWAQRALVGYLPQSPHPALRPRWLPGLLQGTPAGAPGPAHAQQ